MKYVFKIGQGCENDIVIKAVDCPKLHAEIRYIKGSWVLTNIAEDKPVFVNGEEVKQSMMLSKYDKIILCRQTIHWSNHLYEGEEQELKAKDVLLYHGRISRSNFRALSLLALGVSTCLFFLPGLLVAYWKYLNRKRLRHLDFDSIDKIQQIAPSIYSIGYGLLLAIMLLLAIKRLRDTGNPIWKIAIPGYNLYLLYFMPSK